MTVTVSVRYEKAMQLLQDLADLNLIDLLPADPPAAEPSTPPRLSSFIGQIQTGQTVEQLDQQLSELREEWHRTI